MYVDGQKVSNSHNFWVRFKDRKTPKLTEILSPRYTKVEDKINFYGRVISNLYGKAGSIEEPLVDSDSTTSQLGVFLGGQECDLLDENGNLYGINLSGQNDCGLNGACGDITCKVKGTLIGPLNVEYHVSNYGASQTDKEKYNIDSKGQVYHYHTLASVDSVSQTAGTTGGGQLVEITGSGFDSAPGRTKVYLGEAECDVEAVTNDMVSVRTPPQSSGADTAVFNTMYAGGAGLQYQIWLGSGNVDTSTGLDGIIASLGTASNSTTINTIVDISEPVFTEVDDYTSILSGFFVCTFTSEYEIELESSASSTLYWANLTSNTMEVACTNSHGTSQGACQTERLQLEKGQKYYLSVVYNHVSGAPLKLRLGLKAFTTSINSIQHPASTPEKQRIRFLEYRRNEIQKIELIGDTLPENVKFTMSGVVKNIEFSTSNITKDGGWSTKIKELLSPTCQYPNAMTSSGILDPNDKSIIKCDFEKCLYQGAEESKNSDTEIYGANGWHSNDHEAYCGRGVMWNTDLFLNKDYTVKLQDYPYVCFAYRGNAFRGHLNVYVEYTKVNDTESGGYWLDLYPEHPDQDEGGLFSEVDAWQYRCYDVYELVKKFAWAQTIDESKPVWLQQFKIPFSWGDGLVSLVDELRFSKQIIEIIRTDAALPTNEMLIDTVEVVEDETNDANKIITFETNSCDEFKFDLMGIYGAFLDNINSNDSMAINEYLSSNENATFSHPDWGNSKIRVSRTQGNSIRSQGSYSISYNGKTLPNLNFYLEDYELQRLVQQGLDAPTVSISQGGKCWWKNYDFQWLNEGGEKPLITIDVSKLETDGTTLTSSTEKVQSGNLEISELGPDFFRTPHDEPQISVVVNNYRAWCDSSDGCGYSYSTPGSEPTMVSYTVVNDISSSNKMILSIVGTDFDSSDTTSDRTVKIDETIECTVTAVSDTTTTCSFDPLPAGDYPIRLFVDSFGEALGSFSMSITLEVTAISPTSGALGGGTSVQITGSGFGSTGTTVMINGKACQITSSSVVLIECITPGSASGSYPVTVSYNGDSDATVSYTYDTASTATATAANVSTTLSPVTVRETKPTMMITGTTFGDKTGSVKLSSATCDVITWTDTEIVCSLPSLASGTYDIVIETRSNGYADTTALSSITYNFKVSSISPRVGSLIGGTKMVINGEGFTSDYCQNVEIMIGENMACEVDETDNGYDCSDTQISCTTKRVATVHRVENTGTNAKFGKGYAWDKKDLTIAPGDIVEWRWVLTVSSADSGINIFQREDAGSTMYDGVGFNSGDKKAEGTFRHTFNGLGTSFYTSDSVIGDLNTIFMSGSVTVELPEETAPMSVRAMIGDVEAETDDTRIRSVINKRSSCAEATTTCVTPSANDSFAFTASPCLTPIVSMITVTDGMTDTGNKYLEGHAASTLEISGSGFGTLCQTTVMIGSTNCSITSISSSNIVCTISASDEILPESLHLIEVSVSNNGLAVFEDEKYSKFFVKSMINNVNINQGSFAGGSVMIFNGLGLKVNDNENHVIFSTAVTGAKLCSIVSSTYTELTCRTPSYEGFVGSNELVADVNIEIAGYEPVWDDAVFSSNATVKHRFNYTASLTPSVQTEDITLSGGQGTIKVNGTMFGSSAASVKVYLVSADSPSVVRRTLHPVEDSSPNLAFHRPLNKKVMSEFFRDTLHSRKLSEINWKVGGSANREIAPPSYAMKHFEGSARHTGAYTLFEDDYPLHHHLVDEEDKAVVDKLMSFVQRHSRSNIKKLQQKRRLVRGLEEVQEVEEDVNNMDSSYFGTIGSVTDGSISVTFTDVEAGRYNLMVYVDDVGNAINSFTATSQGIISSISPNTGSTYGGQEVTITGQGFSTDTSSWSNVTIGSTTCEITEATFR